MGPAASKGLRPARPGQTRNRVSTPCDVRRTQLTSPSPAHRRPSEGASAPTADLTPTSPNSPASDPSDACRSNTDSLKPLDSLDVDHPDPHFQHPGSERGSMHPQRSNLHSSSDQTRLRLLQHGKNKFGLSIALSKNRAL